MISASAPAWLMPALTVVADVGIVALLTGYVHLVWSRRRAPLTEAAAAHAFQREHGPAEVSEVLVLADGRTALVRLADGRLGAVTARGRGWSTRVLEPADVRAATRDGEAVQLALRDYAHPRLTLRFPSAQARAEWLAPLLPSMGKSAA